MPAAKIYYNNPDLRLPLKNQLGVLRDFLAQQLSAPERALKSNEMSLRMFFVEDGLPIAPVEIEVTAFPYPLRVGNEDKICKAISGFLASKDLKLADNYVWLKLCELGHSG